MNLVDAIRKASAQAAAEVPQTEQYPQRPMPAPQTPESNQPNDVSPAVTGGGGSVVRLELFLSPEQMHQMLRGILAGAHSVMTLREAARHLRTSIHSVVALAETGEIPAFMVDGDWKFPRQGVEEWMTLQSLKTREEQRNVA